MKQRLAAVLGICLLCGGAAAEAKPGDIARSIPSPTQAPHHATYPFSVAYDGAALYVVNIEHAGDPKSPRKIFKLAPADGAVLQSLSYAGQQTLKQATWDGDKLWAVGIPLVDTKLERHQQRALVDLKTGAVKPAYLTTPTSRGLAWDFGCGQIWDLVGKGGTQHKDSSTEIHLRKTDGASSYKLDTAAVHDSWYGLAYDGCSLWSVDYGGQQLVRLEIASGAELERLPAPAAKSIGVVYDGTHLVVSSNDTDRLYFIEIGDAKLAGGNCTPSLTNLTCRAPGQPTVGQFPFPKTPDGGPGGDTGSAGGDGPGSDGSTPNPDAGLADASTDGARADAGGNGSDGGCQVASATRNAASVGLVCVLLGFAALGRRRRPNAVLSPNVTPKNAPRS